MRKTLLASFAVLAVIVVAALAVLRALHPSTPESAKLTPKAAPAVAPTQTPAQPPAHPAAAADHPPDGKAPAAPVWTVDKEASRLTFRGAMDGVPFDGVFRDWDAQVAFDPKNLKGSRATITVQTASALTGQPIKDQALPNSEWLSATAFPTATLVTRQISQTAPGRYLASADVKIRGVNWRTSVPFAVAIGRDSGRMQATLTLDRRTFGIGEGPFKSPPPVAPQVQVTLRMVAKKSR